jgi:hypothetical protein
VRFCWDCELVVMINGMYEVERVDMVVDLQVDSTAK